MEVEEALRNNPAVAEAVVVVRENIPGESQLVAYFTTRTQNILSVNEFRRLLKTKLPDYMIPSVL